MKFTNLFIALAASVVLYSCESSDKPAETSNVESTETATYTVDTEQSAVNWKGSMVGLYSHNGTVKLTEGSLSLAAGKLAGGNFTVDLTSINPLDSGYSAERPKEGLIGHLQQADFFATDSFPTASFVIKSVEGNTATGELTVRGKTNEEKVTDIVLNADGDQLTATGKLVFNRQKYDVAYKASMKDMVLSDDIEVTVTLVGKK
jgi:polyisoprenoid-binding protein YceI